MVKILSFRVLDPEKQRVVAPPEEPLYFCACEQFYLLYTKSGMAVVFQVTFGLTTDWCVHPGKIQVLAYSESEAVIVTEFKPKSRVQDIRYLSATDSYDFCLLTPRDDAACLHDSFFWEIRIVTIESEEDSSAIMVSRIYGNWRPGAEVCFLKLFVLILSSGS